MSPKENVEMEVIQIYKRLQIQEKSYLKMIMHFKVFLLLYKPKREGHLKLENESKFVVK